MISPESAAVTETMPVYIDPTGEPTTAPMKPFRATERQVPRVILPRESISKGIFDPATDILPPTTPPLAGADQYETIRFDTRATPIAVDAHAPTEKLDIAELSRIRADTHVINIIGESDAELADHLINLTTRPDGSRFSFHYLRDSLDLLTQSQRERGIEPDISRLGSMVTASFITEIGNPARLHEINPNALQDTGTKERTMNAIAGQHDNIVLPATKAALLNAADRMMPGEKIDHATNETSEQDFRRNPSIPVILLGRAATQNASNTLATVPIPLAVTVGGAGVTPRNPAHYLPPHWSPNPDSRSQSSSTQR